MGDEKIFEGWAIVELMGHRRLAGYVTEVEIAGAAMLRLDVPEHPWVDGCTCGSDQPETANPEHHPPHCFMFRAPDDERPGDVHATQFYSSAALYCLTPTTEEMARAVRARPAPVQQWELPRRQIEPPRDPIDDLEEDLDEQERAQEERDLASNDLSF